LAGDSLSPAESFFGLHNADIADPNLKADLTTILNLKTSGVAYTNASTTKPSDSFPGTLSYLTGAGPGTTGVFYDDCYSRTLLPSIDQGGGSTPGTEVQYFEAIDKNLNLISGGGNFDASSIDPNELPRDPTTGQPVFPNQFLQVNTIFDVAHQAGLYTAFSDKHPAYQIANGDDPNAINDFYGPEINSTTAASGQTTATRSARTTAATRRSSPRTTTRQEGAGGSTVKSNTPARPREKKERFPWNPTKAMIDRAGRKPDRRASALSYSYAPTGFYSRRRLGWQITPTVWGRRGIS
jgi:hypothetical protein